VKVLPSVEELHRLFSYDPLTGILRWKVRLSSKRGVGEIAGTLTPDGYIRIKVRGCGIFAHQIAFAMHNGYWPTLEVDHKSRVRTQNTALNLREATGEMQRRNRVCVNSTGYRGVGRLPGNRVKPYQAQIRFGKRRLSLGAFTTTIGAAEAYDAAVLKYCGPDFPTNKSLGLLP
jgi:hypothetical protein